MKNNAEHIEKQKISGTNLNSINALFLSQRIQLDEDQKNELLKKFEHYDQKKPNGTENADEEDTIIHLINTYAVIKRDNPLANKDLFGRYAGKSSYRHMSNIKNKKELIDAYTNLENTDDKIQLIENKINYLSDSKNYNDFTDESGFIFPSQLSDRFFYILLKLYARKNLEDGITLTKPNAKPPITNGSRRNTLLQSFFVQGFQKHTDFNLEKTEDLLARLNIDKNSSSEKLILGGTLGLYITNYFLHCLNKGKTGHDLINDYQPDRDITPNDLKDSDKVYKSFCEENNYSRKAILQYSKNIEQMNSTSKINDSFNFIESAYKDLLNEGIRVESKLSGRILFILQLLKNRHALLVEERQQSLRLSIQETKSETPSDKSNSITLIEGISSDEVIKLPKDPYELEIRKSLGRTGHPLPPKSLDLDFNFWSEYEQFFTTVLTKVAQEIKTHPIESEKKLEVPTNNVRFSFIGNIGKLFSAESSNIENTIPDGLEKDNRALANCIAKAYVLFRLADENEIHTFFDQRAHNSEQSIGITKFLSNFCNHIEKEYSLFMLGFNELDMVELKESKQALINCLTQEAVPFRFSPDFMPLSEQSSHGYQY